MITKTAEEIRPRKNNYKKNLKALARNQFQVGGRVSYFMSDGSVLTSSINKESFFDEHGRAESLNKVIDKFNTFASDIGAVHYQVY